MININEEKGNLHPLTLFKELATHFNVPEKDFERLELEGGEHIYFQTVKHIVPEEIYASIEKIQRHNQNNTQNPIHIKNAEINHHLLIDYCVSKSGNEMLTLKKVTGKIDKERYLIENRGYFEDIQTSIDYGYFSACTEPIIVYDKGKIYSFGNKKQSMYPSSMTDIFYYQNKSNVEYDVFKIIMECYGRDYPIWKDLAKDFEKGCPYASIPLDVIFSCNNRRELIRKRYGEKYALKRNNRETIGQGIFLARAARVVKGDELQKLYNFTCPPMKIGRSKTDVAAPIAEYILQTIDIPVGENNGDISDILWHDLVDIVRMSCQAREKVSITYKSMNKIEEVHWELATKQRMRSLPLVKIPKDSKFKWLNMPDCCTRLTSRKAFIEEGNRQNNCVTSYIEDVNHDNCSIWSADYMGQHMTIEICYNKKAKKFFINQCFTTNNNYTEECKKLRTYIQKFI